MKKSLILLGTAMLLFTATHAQEKQKIQEVGFVFRNLDSFGATYRIGNTNSVWRLTAMTVGWNSTESESGFQNPGVGNSNETESSRFNMDLGIGREKRISIVENLDFRLGVEAGFGYGINNNTSKIMDSTGAIIADNKAELESIRVRLSGIAGVNYNVKDKLIIGLEILPRVAYNTNQSTQTSDGEEPVEASSNTISANLGLNSATLSLAYRF